MRQDATHLVYNMYECVGKWDMEDFKISACRNVRANNGLLLTVYNAIMLEIG